MECPTLAIKADGFPMASSNREHYARLHKRLEEAAAQGRFRWRMDPDSLDPDDIMIKPRQRAMKAKDGSSGD
jgi:hypothetical protein